MRRSMVPQKERPSRLMKFNENIEGNLEDLYGDDSDRDDGDDEANDDIAPDTLPEAEVAGDVEIEIENGDSFLDLHFDFSLFESSNFIQDSQKSAEVHEESTVEKEKWNPSDFIAAK